MIGKKKEHQQNKLPNTSKHISQIKMKLTFYSNYLNHHQVLVADELNRILGDDYHFVATLKRNKTALKGGADYSARKYCILAGESIEAQMEALRLAQESDVCIFGADSQKYAVHRAKMKPKGLSFELGERWFKHGLFTIASPVFRQWYTNYLKYYRNANFHKLCCSSFTAGDDNKLLAYRGRHYKWAYFTQVDNNWDVEASIDNSTSEITTLMWCGRFLVLKHPELPVKMAARLKNKGYKFQLVMYGDEANASKRDKVYPRTKLEALIKDLGVDDSISLKGNRPNADVLQGMRKSDIFLFTSDRLEGWGAVANESLANACVLIASDAIGSTSYLINEGENGFSFHSQDIESLTEKVEWLLSHPEELKHMQKNAYLRMKRLWSPQHAADSLLSLISDLQNGREISISEGPCSIA